MLSKLIDKAVAEFAGDIKEADITVKGKFTWVR
jgi:hypothetical protein